MTIKEYNDRFKTDRWNGKDGNHNPNLRYDAVKGNWVPSFRGWWHGYRLTEGGLIRVRLKDEKVPIGDWRWWPGFRRVPQYRYFCNTCGTTLTDGPCGGASINVVCEKCRVNYGCLPYYEGEMN
jgi:hypothetical protein